jgi:predicted dehydrogenase
VLCEKPLAPTPAEIRKMIAARDRSGKMLMTAQHFRFTPTAQALKREIDRGTLGQVYHARCWMLRRAATPCNTNFTLKRNSGGGPCIDIGVHILDLTLWMMGHPRPVAVSGVTHAPLHRVPSSFSIWGGKLPGEWDVEELALGTVRFDNGASLVLEVSWLLHHKIPPEQYEDMQMWLYGTRGGAHWPSDEILRSDGEKQELIDARLKCADDPLRPHARECVAFAEAIVEGKPSPVPAEQALELMSILQGLYRSAEEGCEVKVQG